MIKPFYIFLFTLCFCCETKSQTSIEYITNGSFEQIDSCYGNVAAIGFDIFEWSGCKGWNNPIKSSSDLWCINPKVGAFYTPYIGSVFQVPRTGSNYAAILINDVSIHNYREYIQNQLAHPFIMNRYYEVSFYLNYANLYECSPNIFGIKFFNQKLNDYTKLWLTDLLPDVINTESLLLDTLIWQKVSFKYKANGNEKFLVIGNFEDSLHLSYTLPCDTTNWGLINYATNYVFIDDVSIIEMEKQNPSIPNIFTPNSDDINDLWYCDFNEYDDVNCTIYNRWGNKVFETKNKLIQWDGKTTSGMSCNDGVYFYIIETEIEKHKGYIQLMR